MPTNELFPVPEMRTLFAVADRIVPSDQYGLGHLLGELAPGGVLYGHRDACQSFLTRLNAESGGDFAALSSDGQDDLLKRMETIPETAQPFRQIVEWVTEGFYASPAGWDFVGFRPVDRETR